MLKRFRETGQRVVAPLAASPVVASASSSLRTSTRRYVRKLWEKRGGGFYGFVATLMFLYLEVLDIAGDIVDMAGTSFGLGWLISFVVSNIITIIMNTVRAALWPMTWLSKFGVGVMSAALLGAAYVAYLMVRPWVMQMLQEPGDAEAALDRAASRFEAMG
jgi:hypothetical protein